MDKVGGLHPGVHSLLAGETKETCNYNTRQINMYHKKK